MKGSYKDLLVWQQAMDLIVMVYAICRKLPKEETFGLSSQLRRAVVSIPSNIAEGSGRRSPKEFRQHLRIAYGSLCEVETQLLIIERLELTQGVREALKQVASVNRLIRSLSNSLTPPPSAETYETSETYETT